MFHPHPNPLPEGEGTVFPTLDASTSSPQVGGNRREDDAFAGISPIAGWRSAMIRDVQDCIPHAYGDAMPVASKNRTGEFAAGPGQSYTSASKRS